MVFQAPVHCLRHVAKSLAKASKSGRNVKARTKDWIHTFGVLVHSKLPFGTLDQESTPCQLDCQGQKGDVCLKSNYVRSTELY